MRHGALCFQILKMEQVDGQVILVLMSYVINVDLFPWNANMRTNTSAPPPIRPSFRKNNKADFLLYCSDCSRDNRVVRRCLDCHHLSVVHERNFS